METALTLGAWLYANGGDTLNPMGFPGYGYLYTGSHETYRWMLQHPILRLVRSIRLGIIAANSWEYVKADEDDNVPEEWIKWTKKTFDPLRYDLIWEFMADGMDHGWKGAEPIWEPDGIRYRLVRLKPLLQDITEVLEDDHGNFTGLRNIAPPKNSASNPIDIYLPYKAWKFTFDGLNGYHYGRAWLENVRATAWKDWLDGAQQLQKLGAKITGMVSIITSPAGTFQGPPDPATGKPTQVSFRENAEKIIKGLAAGAAGAWLPSIGLTPDAKGNIDALKVMAQLIGKSLTNIQVLDFGTQAAAMSPILDRMIHAEELMFAGGLRSARTGLEGQHGTKAEAGEHTNTGTFNAESDDEGFSRAVQPLVDANLMLNFSPKAKGRVRIKPPSLVDRKASLLRALLMGLINDKQISARVAKIPGLMDALLRALDVTSGGKFDADSINTDVDQPPKVRDEARRSPEPEGGRPKQE